MGKQYDEYKKKLKKFIDSGKKNEDGKKYAYSDETIAEAYRLYDKYYKQTDNPILSYNNVIRWFKYGVEMQWQETKADSWGEEFGQWGSKIKEYVDDIYNKIKDMGNGGLPSPGDLDFGFDFSFGFDKLLPEELGGVLKESQQAIEAVPELLHGLTDIIEDIPSIIKSVSGSAVSLIDVLIQIFINILVVIQRLTVGFVYFTQPMWLAFISVIVVLGFLYKYRK